MTFHKSFDRFPHFTPKPWEQLPNPGIPPKPWEQFQNPGSSHPSLVQAVKSFLLTVLIADFQQSSINLLCFNIYYFSNKMGCILYQNIWVCSKSFLIKSLLYMICTSGCRRKPWKVNHNYIESYNAWK